jgi:hypothetical protein
VRLSPPTEHDTNPVDYFLASVNDLFEQALQDALDADIVGIAIHNEVNQNDKSIGISFRRRDHLPENMIWSVFEVSQSNSRLNAFNTLTVVVNSVRMLVEFSDTKTKSRPLSAMAHLKKSIIEVNAERNFLAQALFVAIAKVTNHSNYKSYRYGRKISPVVSHLLETTGINLDNGAGIPKLIELQDHFSQFKIFVYDGLNCDSIMFEGQVESSERLNLLYDDVSRHYHVIENLTAAMTKGYVCKECGKGWSRDTTHTCDRTCSDCMASPPCVSAGVRIPCTDCNRHFRGQACFDNHKTKRGNKKAVFEHKRNCGFAAHPSYMTVNTNVAIDIARHAKRTELGHLCYMQPLMNVLPLSDTVLYVLYDFETTQNTRYSDRLQCAF